MKQVTTLLLLLLGGFLTWRIGETLSSDAISMGVGIFFGMLAGIPASLLVLAAARRREYHDYDDEPPVRRTNENPNPYATQPPVIVLAGMGGLPQQGMMGAGTQGPAGLLANGMAPVVDGYAWSQPRPTREYRIVGEVDQPVDEW